VTIEVFFRNQLDVPKELGARLFQVTCWISFYHRDQHRLSGGLSVEHCFTVMGDMLDIWRDPIVVAGGGLDEDVIIAAGLHDVVEDTNVTLDMIAAVFGSNVAYLVKGCSKKPLELFDGDVVAQQNDLHLTILSHAEQHYGVILIRLGCRQHNQETIKGLPVDRQIAMADDTLDFYLPLLGNEARILVPTHLHPVLDRYARKLEYNALAILPANPVGPKSSSRVLP